MSVKQSDDDYQSDEEYQSDDNSVDDYPSLKEPSDGYSSSENSDNDDNDDNDDMEDNETESSKIFFKACIDGDITTVQGYLDDDTFDPNIGSDKQSPLCGACEYEQYAVIKILVSDDRVDLNKGNEYDETPLIMACANNDIDTVKLLLDNPKVDINKHDTNCGETAFIHSCYYRSYDAIKILLENDKLDITAKDCDDETGLHSLCNFDYRHDNDRLSEHIEITKLIIDHPQTDLNARDASGSTPLHNACMSAFVPIVKHLLENPKLNPMMKGDHGDTVFHHVINWAHTHMKGSADSILIMKLLLEDDRCDPNEPNNDGDTPFMTLCDENFIDAIQCFIENCDSVDLFTQCA